MIFTGFGPQNSFEVFSPSAHYPTVKYIQKSFLFLILNVQKYKKPLILESYCHIFTPVAPPVLCLV
jgi:hypothetical protein